MSTPTAQFDYVTGDMNSLCLIVDKPPNLLYKTVSKCTNCGASGLGHSTNSTSAQLYGNREGSDLSVSTAVGLHVVIGPETGHQHNDTEVVTQHIRRRRAYTREEKLKAVDFYRKCGRNKYKTCKEWKIDSRTLSRWIKDEMKIRQLRPGKMAARFRTAKYPVMEEELHQEYCNMLDIGQKVDTLWLREKAQEIMNKLSPQAEFKFSACWLRAFKRRYGISFRKKKDCAEIFPLPIIPYY